VSVQDKASDCGVGGMQPSWIKKHFKKPHIQVVIPSANTQSMFSFMITALHGNHRVPDKSLN
jgi:hypothetical protein